MTTPNPNPRADLSRVALDTIRAQFVLTITLRAVAELLRSVYDISPEATERFTALVIRRTTEIMEEYRANQTGGEPNGEADTENTGAN